MNDYTDWIAANVPPVPIGKCREVTKDMATAFPELTRVRGHYREIAFQDRPARGQCHWWLVTASGEIVDPTAAQFPCQGAGQYVAHIEGSEEPGGRCLYCGGYVYGGRHVHDGECLQAVEADLNRGL